MKRPRAFTLIELVVVISIIAILVAILFPVLTRARNKSKESACIQQMRQVGLALQLYREGYDDGLPERLSALHPGYAADARLLICPLDPQLGHHEETSRLEGDAFLDSGVSYTYVPSWKRAIEWGWWNEWPNSGNGKWNENTPVSECHWHWARRFHPDWQEDQNKTRGGSAVILTKDGAVHFWPGKLNVMLWDPQ
jgi:prepilin-type N-terminal cleavage/methylation domain-containing protein